MNRRNRFFPLAALLAAIAGPAAIGFGDQRAPAVAGNDIAIGFEDPLIKTGVLEMNRRGQRESLEAKVVISIQNQSGKPASTSVEMTGKEKEFADVELEKSENTSDGQQLHLKIAGRKPSTAASESLLTIEVTQDGKVKAKKSLPVRVVIPAGVKTGDPELYEGPARPGLVNRALNMRTYPKASVRPPEAKLASMCVHDVTMTALDQFGEPLPPIYEGALVFAALGESHYESTNRVLTKNSTWIDIAGLWQFVGEVKNMETEPDRSEVARFTASPAAPCKKTQYRAYEPLTLQWQIGGHPVGTFKRQITLIDSGDDHKPNMRITLEPSIPEQP